jgi:ATP synthase protein I
MVFSQGFPSGFPGPDFPKLPGRPMEEEKKRLLKTLGMISTMGISFAVAIAIGVFMGLKLDEWLGTKPWCFFIFLFFGIAAGFRNVYIMANREIKRGDNGKDT